MPNGINSNMQSDLVPGELLHVQDQESLLVARYLWYHSAEGYWKAPAWLVNSGKARKVW